MKLNPRFALACLLVVGLAACATDAFVMNSESLSPSANPIRRLLIVTNGQVFPEVTRNQLFSPTVERVRNLFVKHGIEADTHEMPTASTAARNGMVATAKQFRATHLLSMTVQKATLYGPRLAPAGDPRGALSAVMDYTYAFVLADLRSGREIWKGELKSGFARNLEDELRQIEARVEEHLMHAKLLESIAVSSPSNRG